MGRQETLHFMPTSAADTGRYLVRVYQFPDDPGGIQNGSVALDLSRGPVAASGGAANTPPVAIIADGNRTFIDDDGDGVENVLLNGSGSNDPDGSIDSYEWSVGSTSLGNSPTLNYDFQVGTHNVTLTVTDNGGATDTDQVVITIQANSPPVANAGPDRTVTATAGNDTQSVTFDGSGSRDPDGSIVNYQWNEGVTPIGTGVTPSAVLGVGTHTIILTVTDNGGATASDQVVITVEAGGTTTNTLHVAALEGSAVAKGKKARKWQVFVTVTVEDQNGDPLAGALVSGSWSGAASGLVSGTTDGTGTVTLSTSNLNGGSSVLFTVNNVSLDGYDYDAGSSIQSVTVTNQ